MLFSVYLAGALVMFWAGTAWLQRSSIEIVDLDPSGPYVVRSSAGPIELTGEGSTFEYEASWLLFGPDVVVGTDTAPGNVEISCETRFPCRAVSRLALPKGSTSVVTIESVDGDVWVNAFAGDLAVLAAGSAGAYLSSVGGQVSIDSQGGEVAGYGLTASELSVDTSGGAVDLDFASRPRSVVVRSEGGPVTIGLPDGDYAVSVKGDSSAAINVGQVASADSTIQIHARGPVRIDPTR